MADDPLVIFNPVAGAGDRSAERDRIKRALSRAGLPSEWSETTVERDAGDIIRDDPGEGLVVVMGGDGTIQAAARELQGGRRSLAIVPMGTGNVVAQRLGIPFLLEAALKVAKEGVLRQLDVGTCMDQPVLLAAGMGIDGRLIRDADRELKQRFGVFAYIASALRNFPARHYEFALESEGFREEHTAASVVVANLGTQVGPWIFPPDGSADDGKLEVIVIRMANLAQVASVLASPLPLRRARKREKRGVYVYRASNVRVVCARPLPLQVDGEDMGDCSEFTVAIEPGSLSVMVPVKPSPWRGIPDLRRWPPR